jgi:hypothetical protein
MTLAYLGEHPNRDVMSYGLNYLCGLDADRDFNQRSGYAVPIRIMALSYVYNRASADRQVAIKRKIQEDMARIIKGQSAIGGWRYELNRADYDNSVSQWPLLAMYEANRIGIEFPMDSLKLAKAYYLRGQHLNQGYRGQPLSDGGWGYQFGGRSYGSMTAAGLASLYIISDLIEPASGCPCVGGRSQASTSDIDRSMDAALLWLCTNYDWPTNFDQVYYWLYCVERVGISAGYKHFGEHNWYKEGVHFLIPRQLPEGSWEEIDPVRRMGVEHWGGGKLPDTCFALLFLHKGRAPVLFNKLRFEGTWNAHRRDVANLTHYVEWAKEQLFHWQVVDLAAPIEELHDAPVLFISAESAPKWGAAEKAKLRAFTDSGGTVLFEASCGNPAVREWFNAFAKEVWPEWPLKPLAGDHAVFADPYPLSQRPELLGMHDGLRTFLFYAMDDISCPWHMKAYTSKEYLFRWGINLFTYAMDRGPLRAKLANAAPPAADRHKEEIKAGPRKLLRVARVKYDSNWEVGANYGALARLAQYMKGNLGVTVEVRESNTPPVTATGIAPEFLTDFDVAYVTGSKEFTFTDAEKAQLKAFTDRGGFLWVEAAGGALPFVDAFKTTAASLGWTLKVLPNEHPLMSGRLEGGQGYDLTQGIEFRQVMRLSRANLQRAELVGIFAGDKMIGVFSPFDLCFSLSPFEAYGCRGYKSSDAGAVVLNVLLYLTTLK